MYNKANDCDSLLEYVCSRLVIVKNGGQKVVVINDNGRYSSVAIAVSSFVQKKKMHGLPLDGNSLVHII